MLAAKAIVDDSEHVLADVGPEGVEVTAAVGELAQAGEGAAELPVELELDASHQRGHPLGMENGWGCGPQVRSLARGPADP